MDLCVAHLGKHNIGIAQVIKSQATNLHYCTVFFSYLLVVPEEVRSKLTDVHKNYQVNGILMVILFKNLLS